MMRSAKPADAFATTKESGPYYLVSYVPSLCRHRGGVKTDTDCRVIDEGRHTIKRLSPLAKSPIVSCTTAASCATARTRAL